MENDDMTSDPWDEFGDFTPSAPPSEKPESTPPAEEASPPPPPPPPPPPAADTPAVPTMDDLGEHFAALASSDAADVPEVPEIPSVETLEEAAPSAEDVEGLDGDADMPEAPALGVEGLDLEAPDLEPAAEPLAADISPVSEPLEIEVPDFAGSLEIPDLDLSGFEGGEPETQPPTAPDVSIADLGLADIDIPDLENADTAPGEGEAPAAEIPELEGEAGAESIESVLEDVESALGDAESAVDEAKSELEDVESAGELPAPPQGGAPFSPLLAATGLFGSQDSAKTSAEEPDVEPPAGSAPGEEPDSDIHLGGTPPPSVYSELEDLTASAEPAPPEVSDDWLATVDSARAEAVEPDASGQEDGAEGGAEETADSDPPAVEPIDLAAAWDAPDEPEEADLAALAAIVAEVDPVVLGADEEDEAGDELSIDTDDWLADEEEAPGLDIGITLGSKEPDLPEDTETGGDVAVEEVPAEEVASEDLAVEDVVTEDVVTEDVVTEDVVTEDVAVEDVALGGFAGWGDDDDFPAEDAAEDAGEEDAEVAGAAGMAAALGGAAAIGLLGEDQASPAEPSPPELPDYLRDVEPALAGDAALEDAALEVAEPGELAAPEPPEFPGVLPEAVPAEPEPEPGDEVSVPAEPEASSEPLLEESDAGSLIAGGGEAWGARWKESAQGWVEDESGSSTWRPIVTTSPILSEWEVDTYLGVVVGDTAFPAEIATGSDVSEARESSTRRMIDEALARGAHAVVGVAYNVQPIGSEILVTATGTAVTLRADSSS